MIINKILPTEKAEALIQKLERRRKKVQQRLDTNRANYGRVCLASDIEDDIGLKEGQTVAVLRLRSEIENDERELKEIEYSHDAAQAMFKEALLEGARNKYKAVLSKFQDLAQTRSEQAKAIEQQTQQLKTKVDAFQTTNKQVLALVGNDQMITKLFGTIYQKDTLSQTSVDTLVENTLAKAGFPFVKHLSERTKKSMASIKEEVEFANSRLEKAIKAVAENPEGPTVLTTPPKKSEERLYEKISTSI